MNAFRSAIEKLKNSSFCVSVFKVGSGELIAQILSLISVPILSRIYSDAAYGEVALITSTAAVVLNLSTLGFNAAIMKPKDDEQSRKVFTTAFLANFVICSGFTAFYAFFSKKKQLFSVSGSYGLALLMMWSYCMLYETKSLMIVYLNRKQKYNKLFFNPIIGSASNLLVAVPLGLLGFGFEGFMLTYILQDLAICTLMIWGDSPFRRHYKLRDFVSVIVEYKEYILFHLPADFMRNTSIEYPTLYMGRVFPSGELGDYSMCERILKLPIRLIAAPISTVYFRTASEYHREGRNLADFTFKMVFRILLISILPVAFFMFISEPLFALVLGKTWREAGALASFLIVQYVLMFCAQTTSYCRVSIGRQKTDLAVSLVRFAIAVVSCFIGFYEFHTMRGTVVCYSIGQCIYNIFDLAASFYCMEKKYVKKYLVLSISYSLLMYAVLMIKGIVLPG